MKYNRTTFLFILIQLIKYIHNKLYCIYYTSEPHHASVNFKPSTEILLLYKTLILFINIYKYNRVSLFHSNSFNYIPCAYVVSLFNSNSFIYYVGMWFITCSCWHGGWAGRDALRWSDWVIKPGFWEARIEPCNYIIVIINFHSLFIYLISFLD